MIYSSWLQWGCLMEQWVQFAQDKWYIILGALIVIWVALSLVKTMVKWLVIAVIVAALFFYGTQYQEELKSWSSQVLDMATEESFLELKESISQFTTREAVELGLGLASEAKVEIYDDQTYTVTAKHFQIDGTLLNGEVASDVTVRLKSLDKSLSINLNDYKMLRQFMIEAISYAR